jgi:mono/diheme cytochrome c family protein
MTMPFPKTFAAAVLGMSLFTTACSRFPSQDPPIQVWPDMKVQPKYKTQAQSPFFSDQRADRRPIEGTVPQGGLDPAAAYSTGEEGGQYLARNPEPLTTEVLARGQERFNIYCAPCHDRTGTGKGVVPARSTWVPGNLHDERIVNFVDGELFHVISQGRRSMPGYRFQIPEKDRWAIVAYVRALQLAWRGTMADVPADLQGKVR